MSEDAVAAAAATTTGLHGYYRWHAHIYDLTRWAFLFGRTELIRQAASMPGARPRRILEVGCGTGKNLTALAAAFPAAEIVGLDLSAEMLAKARQKIAAYGGRITLLERPYDGPVAGGRPFDLIVFSYCLTMINPGFAEVLRICRDDLSAAGGQVAVVDFHDTRSEWFRRWMRLNHVRMDGQVLAALEASGFAVDKARIRSAYGGLWQWLEIITGAGPQAAVVPSTQRRRA